MLENLPSKLLGAILLLVAVAVVARVVWGLLGPLLTPILTLLLFGALVTFIIRGPRSGGGLFHK